MGLWDKAKNMANQEMQRSLRQQEAALDRMERDLDAKERANGGSTAKSREFREKINQRREQLGQWKD